MKSFFLDREVLPIHKGTLNSFIFIVYELDIYVFCFKPNKFVKFDYCV